jgi:hypothetical protein
MISEGAPDLLGLHARPPNQPRLRRLWGAQGRAAFVEIPGLLEGANDDHGGSQAYLGALREADAIYCQDATAPPDRSALGDERGCRAEIERPCLLALTKFDHADAHAVERFGTTITGLPM